MRAKLFFSKIKNHKVVKPSSLPPTSDAAAQHSFREFHTIQFWSEVILNPLHWGWYLKGNELYPVMTTQLPAPNYILSYIHHACKEDGCQSDICFFRKYGISCSLSCVNCNGLSCNNPQHVEESEMDTSVNINENQSDEE